MRITLLGGAIGPCAFFSAVMIGATLRPEYDHATQVMSALGATDSPNAFIMNVFGFLLTGSLMLAFAFGLARFGPRSLVERGRGPSRRRLRIGHHRGGCLLLRSRLHRHRRRRGRRTCISWLPSSRSSPRSWRASCSVPRSGSTGAGVPMSIFSVVMGLLSGALLYVFNAKAETGSLVGVWQRLFIASLFSWCIVVSLFAYRLSASNEDGRSLAAAGGGGVDD